MNHKIGLVGFGVVGQGYYQIAENDNKAYLPEHIVVKTKDKIRHRDIPFIFDIDHLIAESEIMIELISDTNVAFQIIKNLLIKGRKVITANKKVVAAHLPELIHLQKQHGGTLLYEAAVAASIPILSNLQTQYQGDQITEIQGILNGSSNYILSQIFINNLPFNEALALAQAKGFAESDPSFDLNGSDVASKLCIIIAHAFGEYYPEDTIPCFGIENLGDDEVELANELGLRIKLIATAQKIQDEIEAYILPTLVELSNPLSDIEWEYNGILISSDNLGEQFYKGKGAGSLPTGAAVYSDLVKSIEGFKYTYPDTLTENQICGLKSAKFNVILRSSDFNDLNKLNLKQGQLLEINGAGWFVGEITSEYLLEQKQYFITKGISLINLGNAISTSQALKMLHGIKVSDVLTGL